MRQRLLAALALAACASPLGAQSPDLVRVTDAERVADRVHIRIATARPLPAVPSEPFHLGGGRTRVFITLPGGTLDAPFDTLVPAAGMLALRADAYDGAVRVTADVAGLREHGIERTPEGFDLWLQLERPADAGAADPARPAQRDYTARATAVAAALAHRAAGIWQAAAARARTVDLDGSPARVALLVTVLVVTLAAWRVVRAASMQRAALRNAPAAAGPARMRHARELAAEGVDADGIARRAGIARDVAALLVTRPAPAKAAGPGTLFRSKAAPKDPGDSR